MSVKELESAITQLPKDELWEFAEWFNEFQATLWDKEIEEDVAAGRLDWILEEVEEDIRAGRTKPL